MSTRYVWSQYSVTISEEHGRELSSQGVEFSKSSDDIDPKNSYLLVCKKYELKFNPSGLLSYYPVGTTASNQWKWFRVDSVEKPNTAAVSTWPYAILTGPDSYRYGDILLIADNSGGREQWCLTSFDGSSYHASLQVTMYENPTYTVSNGGTVTITGSYSWYTSRYSTSANIAKKFTGRKSGPSQNQYPEDGIQNSYYYEYLGCDSIDPTAISYSKQDPESGESITVSVTPGNNAYDGTIYYQYDYSLDGGGTWRSAGSKTTDTSRSIVIPEGSTQFQARVQASDNLGFTSADYVTGVNLAVSNMLAYIGVSGKARKVDKLYVGVNGKARQVVKGYIGVNGKARKFL